MAKPVFDAPQFKTEEGAFAYVEAHLWSHGAVCPKCGNCDQDRIRKMQGKTTRLGLYKCNECRKPFTVRMGTIFESSHLPLHLWLQVIHLMVASKKGISTRQIQRMLRCSMKTAWFLTHRIREAMMESDPAIMGGNGGEVLADETWIGNKPGVERAKGGFRHKHKVVALLDKTTGRTRAIHADGMTKGEVANIVRANVDRNSILVTDEARHYWKVGTEFADHRRVFHGVGNYSKDGFSTNAVEGFFSIFKRGMRGIYQQCSEQHLHRYVNEFSFRYSNREALEISDTMRAEITLKGFVGKRLTNRPVDGNSLA